MSRASWRYTTARDLRSIELPINYSKSEQSWTVTGMKLVDDEIILLVQAINKREPQSLKLYAFRVDVTLESPPEQIDKGSRSGFCVSPRMIKHRNLYSLRFDIDFDEVPPDCISPHIRW